MSALVLPGLEVGAGIWQVLDLFAGPGGIGLGLRALGLDEIGLEVDPATCATRAAAGLATIRADVARYPTGHLAGRVWGVWGSPPCQLFSSAGSGLGRLVLAELADTVRDTLAGRPTLARHHRRVARALQARLAGHPRIGRWPRAERSAWAWQAAHQAMLAVQPARFAHDARPEWVALEQVPEVLPLWRVYATELGRLGYSTWTGVLNSADYGVPQTRRRAILMASRAVRVRPPEPTHSDQRRAACLFGLKPWVSMAEALGWDGTLDPLINSTKGGTRPGGLARDIEEPALTVDGRLTQWTLHANRDQREDGTCQTRPAGQPAPSVTSNSERQWRLVNGNQPNATRRGLAEPASTIAVGHNAAQIEWVRERPATTVQAAQRIARPGHRDRAGGEHQQDGAVRVTLDELAVLQGFPRGYPWRGNRTQQGRQVGDAVPPPLAAAIVGALVRLRAEVTR